MMRDTSLQAYQNISGSLSVRQRLILKAIQEQDSPITDSELTRYLEFSDPNKVRPRRNELARMGLIKAVEKKVCDVTGQLAYAWSIK